jgi:hypothetical protein
MICYDILCHMTFMMGFDGDFTMITNDRTRFYGDFMVIQWDISREIFTIPVTTSSDHRIMMWDHSQVFGSLGYDHDIKFFYFIFIVC